MWTKVDGILEERYYRTSYDTNYVVRPEGKLTLKLRGNMTGNSIRSKGTVDDEGFNSHLSTNHKTTISIGAAYRGISLAYSINPAKLRGFYDDYELNFNFYASRFCIDASYQDFCGEERILSMRCDNDKRNGFAGAGYES